MSAVTEGSSSPDDRAADAGSRAGSREGSRAGSRETDDEADDENRVGGGTGDENRVGGGTGDDMSKSPPAPDVSGAETENRDALSARRGSRRVLIAVVVTASLFSAVGVGAGMWIKSPAQRAADAAPPPSSLLTRPVEQRVLTSDVVTRGTVAAEQSLTVSPQTGSGGGEGAAGSVVSGLPVKAGSSVKAGQVLLEVSGRPVFALEGSIPAYRDLKPGMRGQDVTQLRDALRKRGLDTGQDAKGVFGPATKAALTAFYSSIGYEPLPATDDGGETLKAATTTLTAAARAVEDAQSALSDAYYALGKVPAGEDRTEAQRAVDNARRTLGRAIEDRNTARQDREAAENAAGPSLPAAEVVFLSGFPARVDAVNARVGGAVGETAMTVSAGQLLVHAQVNELQVELLKTGQPAEIYAELGQRRFSALLVSVADSPGVPRQGTGSGDEDSQEERTSDGSGYLVVLRPDEAIGAELSGQDVRVTIRAASTEDAELVVPITAVTAGRGGTLYVTVVDSDGEQQQVDVRELTSGGGFVAVAPLKAGSLRKGDRVITGVAADSTTGGQNQDDGDAGGGGQDVS
ncbi:peptidoglycan-binding protein [Streptomyces adelaidensis]|uniref:peptidoglycan-binding protein n=1 Tax=Streptomyces adelaidensis TaxID=2796465 RepID=UPI0019037B8A|nr:peptidoglycan-binding protein [Streptomyces adelaidensis]